MSAKTTSRPTSLIDKTAPVLVVLALVSFALGLYCAFQGLNLDGFACDANGITFLTVVGARYTSHDPNH